jgi:hypothetical protein
MTDSPERALTILSIHLEALNGRGVLLHDLQRYENAFNDSITRIFGIRPLQPYVFRALIGVKPYSTGSIQIC